MQTLLHIQLMRLHTKSECLRLLPPHPIRNGKYAVFSFSLRRNQLFLDSATRWNVERRCQGMCTVMLQFFLLSIDSDSVVAFPYFVFVFCLFAQFQLPSCASARHRNAWVWVCGSFTKHVKQRTQAPSLWRTANLSVVHYHRNGIRLDAKIMILI